jgi:hypothetical protein
VEDPAIERVRKLQPTKPEAAKQEPTSRPKAGEPSPPDTGGASTY